MRQPFLLPLLLSPFLTLAAPASAQSATEVIDAQIAAFRDGDFDTAFTFAAPNLQQIFRTPGAFGQMVQRGYPMVLDPAGVRYLSHGERAGYEVQTVLIEDRQGATFLLEYLFIGEGPTRRIAGVRILPETGTGV